MKPNPKLVLLLSASAFLAACTQTSGPSASPPVAATASAGGCSGEIARFRAVIDSDNATGNVNASVYQRMAAEVDRAAAACAAGQEGAAVSAVRSTKARFGYP